MFTALILTAAMFSAPEELPAPVGTHHHAATCPCAAECQAKCNAEFASLHAEVDALKAELAALKAPACLAVYPNVTSVQHSRRMGRWAPGKIIHRIFGR